MNVGTLGLRGGGCSSSKQVSREELGLPPVAQEQIKPKSLVEPMYLEVLAKYRAKLGERHRRTLQSMNNYGSLLQDEGRHDEAEKLHSQALTAKRATLGDRHPGTLSSINHYTSVLRALGRFDEAEPLCVEVLEGCRITLGSKHPTTVTAIKHYARLLQAQEKFMEAAPLFLEALDVVKANHGVEHTDTLEMYQSSGEVLLGQGDLDSVQKLLSFMETPLLPEVEHHGRRPSAAH